MVCSVCVCVCVCVTCVLEVACSGLLSSLILKKRGNRNDIPFSALTCKTSTQIIIMQGYRVV